MARYINKDEFIAQIQDNFCTECNNYDGVKCKSCGIDDTIEMVENADEADVVPKSEVARELLSDLKKAVHDKAVYSYSKEMYPYINLKTFDAIVAEYISRLDKR